MFKVVMGSQNDGYDDRTVMRIFHKGKQIQEQWDGGEPEDNSFGRSWNWVPFAIEEAYKLGVADGKQYIRDQETNAYDRGVEDGKDSILMNSKGMIMVTKNV